MKRKRILLADNLEHEIADLRKSLIALGYEVRIIKAAEEIIPTIEELKPDLLLIETRIPEIKIPELIRHIKSNSDTTLLPIVLSGNPRTIDERIKFIDLDIDEFFYKPFDSDEIIVRLETLLKESELAKEKTPVTTDGFSGSLAEMSLVDLLQTLDVGKKSGIIRLRHRKHQGLVYIHNGEVINAILSNLESKQALLRMFTWASGHFSVKMQKYQIEKMIFLTTQELISEGITRQYRWKKLITDLPALDSIMIKTTAFPENLNKDEYTIIEMLDGESTIIEIVENSPFDDIKALRILKKLFDTHVIEPAKSDKPMPTLEGSISDFTALDMKPLSEDPIHNAFMRTLQQSPSKLPPQFDRRKNDRRHNDRNTMDRRSGYRSHPGNICLNKSELIMLRKKLLSEYYELK